MHPAFKIYEETTPQLIAFLKNTQLGSNGARYQHLDTEQRLKQLENPLHLSLFRNERIIGNVSFSRRNKDWYVRYFAFDSGLQGSGKSKEKQGGQSFLKNELRRFFQDKIESGEVESFYAYIDPKNDQSFLLAQTLGFVKANRLYTQTFSRVNPKKSKFVEKINEDEARTLIRQHFLKNTYFHVQNNIGKPYVLKNRDGKIIAFATVRTIRWKILRLPGKYGSQLLKIIPFLPVINSIFKPKQHEFLGIDNVWMENQNSQNFAVFFSAILELEKKKKMIWWTAKKPPQSRWGPMHALLSTAPVDLYVICKRPQAQGTTHYSVAADFS